MPAAKLERDKDAVADDIGKALRAARAAQQTAYEDVRSSSTVCTDYLDSAVRSLESAAGWMAEYRKEVQADERRSSVVAKPKPVPKTECHTCGEEIDPGDVAVCQGCDEPTCPNCMGDEGICLECEAEEDEK